MSRDFPVNLWNSAEATLNIAEKLSVEGPAVRLVADIGKAKGS